MWNTLEFKAAIAAIVVGFGLLFLMTPSKAEEACYTIEQATDDAVKVGAMLEDEIVGEDVYTLKETLASLMNEGQPDTVTPVTAEDYPWDTVQIYSIPLDPNSVVVILYKDGCVFDYFQQSRENYEALYELAFGQMVGN